MKGIEKMPSIISNLRRIAWQLHSVFKINRLQYFGPSAKKVIIIFQGLASQRVT
jgi:hypothetical protein